MIGPMRKTIAALIAVCALTGCQNDPAVLESAESPTTPETSAPATNAAEPALAPGSFGPVTIGMSKDDAIATGLLEAGTEPPVEGCPAPPLLWKAPYEEQLDVQVDQQDKVASIGTWKGSTVETTEGIALGSTLAEVQEAYPDASEPKESGYGQSGVIVSDGDDHIGFLFNPPPAELKESDEVTFIEVTSGNEPGLMRDGC
jgi:hypothetical protein